MKECRENPSPSIVETLQLKYQSSYACLHLEDPPLSLSYSSASSSFFFFRYLSLSCYYVAMVHRGTVIYILSRNPFFCFYLCFDFFFSLPFKETQIFYYSTGKTEKRKISKPETAEYTIKSVSEFSELTFFFLNVQPRRTINPHVSMSDTRFLMSHDDYYDCDQYIS